ARPAGTKPVPLQRGQVVMTVCFSTSKSSLMFSLSIRNSPVPLQSGQRIWLSLAALKVPVLSLESGMVPPPGKMQLYRLIHSPAIPGSCLVEDHRLGRLRIHMQLEQVRTGVVAHHVQVAPRHADLLQLDVGIQDALRVVQRPGNDLAA